MAEANKKEQSELVKSVLKLDAHFSDLERLGEKLNGMELKTEFDYEQAQRYLNLFAECGQGISDEIMNLSGRLNEARIRAEGVTKTVAEKAEQLNARKTEAQKKFDEFRALGEKVRAMSDAMAQLRKPEGEKLSAEDRAQLAMRLAEFENQLSPLIEQAQNLRKDAHDSKMKTLEQNADSLTQTLRAIRQKLGGLNLSGSSLPQ